MSGLDILPVELYDSILRHLALNGTHNDIINFFSTNKRLFSYYKANKKHVVSVIFRSVFPIIRDDDDLMNLYEDILDVMWCPLPSLRILDHRLKNEFRKTTWDFLMRNAKEYHCVNLDADLLTDLDELPELTHLYCDNNSIQKLPRMPKLRFLSCPDNFIREFPPLDNVEILICSGNRYLTRICDLPRTKELYCQHCDLDDLPEMPCIETLCCDDNNIKVLPNNMDSISELNCSDNMIKAIPHYKTLKILYCSNNEITALPPLKNISILHCKNNSLERLTDEPELPNMKEIRYSGNRIKSANVPRMPNLI